MLHDQFDHNDERSTTCAIDAITTLATPPGLRLALPIDDRLRATVAREIDALGET